jgi:hypothetical protein
MTHIVFAGADHAIVSPDKFTLGEIAAVERVTGMTFPKLQRRGRMCVCEHDKKLHEHVDAEGVETEDTACTSCACEAHESDLPQTITAAFLWVSVKRGNPSATFSQIEALTPSDLIVDDAPAEVVVPDPTAVVDPQPAA